MPLKSPFLPNLDADAKQQLDDLCHWIDAHLGEQIGWQELLVQSGLEYQTLQTLFFKHLDTTPMTWIRQRREAQVAVLKPKRPILSLAKRGASPASPA
jgi:methylphosphotriester-DNA--protein-cysteine methyltransferase